MKERSLLLCLIFLIVSSSGLAVAQDSQRILPASRLLGTSPDMTGLDASKVEVSMKLFKCRSVHNPFDMQYQQGSEKFADLVYIPSKDAVEFWIFEPGVGDITLYGVEDFQSMNFDLDASTGFIKWDSQSWTSYISLVYLGGKWGLATQVSESHPNADLAGAEIELWCVETPALQEFFDQQGLRNISS